jgi:alpha-1,3-rhamnosyl/mannosyltransferase
MRICIDASQVAYQGTGSGRYVEELVKALLHIDKTNEYTLFGSALNKSETLKSFFDQCSKINDSKLKLKTLPFPPRLFEVFWNSLHTLSIDNFVGDIDIYHSSDWTQSPSKALKVTTVHDLIPFLFPEFVHPRILEAHTARLKWIEKECDAVIVDAAVTKKDIINKFNISPEKIHVIPLACDNRFFEVGQKKLTKSENEDWKELSDVLTKYSLVKNSYILSVGTLEPRKNIKRLVESYIKLETEVKNKYPLVIVGKNAWADALPKESNIHLTGYVEDQDLPYLYAGAKCFVMPSLYEGFGLPVLESMASGTPVVCSDSSSLSEIGGDDVHYIQDPEDVESIRVIVSHLLDSDSTDLKKVAASAFNRAKGFSWERTAKETLEVYNLVKDKR